MTLEERECHYKEGLCFYCHEKGHSVNVCPRKRKKDNVKKVAEIATDKVRRTDQNDRHETNETMDEGKGVDNEDRTPCNLGTDLECEVIVSVITASSPATPIKVRVHIQEDNTNPPFSETTLAFLDSGAMGNFIHPRLVTRC